MLLLAALDNDEARMTNDEGTTNREWRIHVCSDWVCASVAEFSLRKPHENPYE